MALMAFALVTPFPGGRPTLPGDGLVPAPTNGFYSYHFLENLVGCNIHSIGQVVPE